VGLLSPAQAYNWLHERRRLALPCWAFPTNPTLHSHSQVHSTKATDSTILSQLTFPRFVLFVLFSSVYFDIAMSSRDDVLLAAELGLQEWLRRSNFPTHLSSSMSSTHPQASHVALLAFTRHKHNWFISPFPNERCSQRCHTCQAAAS
jgi:hypothetical protein